MVDILYMYRKYRYRYVFIYIGVIITGLLIYISHLYFKTIIVYNISFDIQTSKKGETDIFSILHSAAENFVC